MHSKSPSPARRYKNAGCQDISQVQPNDLIAAYPELEDNDNLLLVGCAPCQPFSNQRRAANEHVAVNLLDEFGRIVQHLNPAHILIENVPGIETRGHAVFTRFLNILNEMHYNVHYAVVNAKDYGVPQNRKRLILIASRLFVPAIPAATHGPGLLPYVTVRNAIEHFPPIAAGQVDENVLNHRSAALQDINLRRIAATPHNGGGRLDWPNELTLNCHAEHAGHTDVYGRMH